MGIIPGSMGTGSFITRGKGNLMSWNSASHGAGRKMSRTQAFNNISQEDFESSMEGVVCDLDPRVKDEAPQAYKDLSLVMQNQESLTEIVHHLLPLVNVKGIESKNSAKYRTVEQQRESLEQEQKSLVIGIKKWEDRIRFGYKDESKLQKAQSKLSKLKTRAVEIETNLASLPSDTSTS